MRKNSRLPNLHNLGIHLRILLIVNLLAVMAAILLSKQLSEFLPLLAQLSALVQPILCRLGRRLFLRTANTSL